MHNIDCNLFKYLYVIFVLYLMSCFLSYRYPGISHGDELLMLFNMGFLSNVKPGDKDYEMSKALVNLWAQFATDECVNDFILHLTRKREVP